MMSNNASGLFVEERQEHIRQYVERFKRVSVSELIQHCKVSPSTIRNDLAALEKKGLIHRTHGGAMSVNRAKVGAESFTSKRVFENIDAKTKIAEKANELIENGDTIALLAGTTNLMLAKTLNNKKSLTVVTNDLAISSWLAENTAHNVYVLGGFVRHKFLFMSFDLCMVESLNVDKAFFSCNAYGIERGAMISDLTLASCQHQLLRRADSVIMLCDSTKFGEVAFARILSTEEIDVIVTDSGVSPQNREILEEMGHPQLVIVP